MRRANRPFITIVEDRQGFPGFDTLFKTRGADAELGAIRLPLALRPHGRHLQRRSGELHVRAGDRLSLDLPLQEGPRRRHRPDHGDGTVAAQELHPDHRHAPRPGEPVPGDHAADAQRPPVPSPASHPEPETRDRIHAPTDFPPRPRLAPLSDREPDGRHSRPADRRFLPRSHADGYNQDAAGFLFPDIEKTSSGNRIDGTGFGGDFSGIVPALDA